MKKTNKHSATTLLTTLSFFFLISAITFAAKPEEFKCKNKELAIKNLIVGIKSENTGLMKSSVYFAGKYQLKETVPALIERLKCANDPNCKVLIALSLYMIGEEEGITAIQQIITENDNAYVKHMLNAICNEYSINKNEAKIASVSK